MYHRVSGSTITSVNDPRILLWSFLRRYKLDELPQLFNILLGDMSFVGPRPDVPGYADCLTGSYRSILSLRPGITGQHLLFSGMKRFFYLKFLTLSLSMITTFGLEK